MTLCQLEVSVVNRSATLSTHPKTLTQKKTKKEEFFLTKLEHYSNISSVGLHCGLRHLLDASRHLVTVCIRNNKTLLVSNNSLKPNAHLLTFENSENKLTVHIKI